MGDHEVHKGHVVTLGRKKEKEKNSSRIRNGVVHSAAYILQNVIRFEKAALYLTNTPPNRMYVTRHKLAAPSMQTKRPTSESAYLTSKCIT
jgi:hypothetical protein